MGDVCLRLCGMPDVHETIARDLTRRLIQRPEIERLTVIGPLLLTVVADDKGVITPSLGGIIGCQRRPLDCAVAAACTLASDRIAIEGIQRHSVSVRQDTISRFDRHWGRRHLDVVACATAESQGGCCCADGNQLPCDREGTGLALAHFFSLAVGRIDHAESRSKRAAERIYSTPSIFLLQARRYAGRLYR